MTTALDDNKGWFTFSEIEFKSEFDSRCPCRIFNVLLLSLNVADIAELKFLAVYVLMFAYCIPFLGFWLR